jgi:hypothetical protein
MRESIQLTFDCVNYARIAVAGITNCNACGEVDVAIAFFVERLGIGSPREKALVYG